MTSSKLLLLAAPLALLALSACGGGDAPAAEEAAEAVPDTFVRPVQREPLTEADLVGFSLAEVSVELPWTTNRVRRGGTPQAARARLQTVDASGHEGFDRAVFAFTDSAPFPGYEIDLGESPVTITCEGAETTLELGGTSTVLVRLRPARTESGPGASGSLRTHGLGLDRLQQGGLVCEDETGLLWAAGLAEAAQVRALELRGPNRLVVDVR